MVAKRLMRLKNNEVLLSSWRLYLTIPLRNPPVFQINLLTFTREQQLRVYRLGGKKKKNHSSSQVYFKPTNMNVKMIQEHITHLPS